jgi:hypothetical protein
MDDLRGIIIHIIKVALVVVPMIVGLWLLLAERTRVQDRLRSFGLGQPGARHRFGRLLGIAAFLFSLLALGYFMRGVIFPEG